MWTCAGLVFALIAHAHTVTRDQFYPYGLGLDAELPKGPELSSSEIPLKVPVRFYGETYESIFVNNHGVLSFRTDIPAFLNTEFPLPYPSIAAFYTNVDTSESGAVFYRETADTRVLVKAEESVQSNFQEYADFKPTSVFIATWLEVSYSGGASTDSKPSNSFQVAIINNGTETFVELLYPERGIQWIQRDTPDGSLPDAKAQAGFVAEDGRMYTLRGSGSHLARNIMSWSNVQQPGKYVFRVGNIDVNGGIEVPDLYNESEIEVEDEYKTCVQSGNSICHIQAKCVDYPNGICCQCNEGFYGNGKSCIKDDVPIRVHGKLTGALNNEYLNDVDIQAYVVVADGRSYTALSQVPPNLGRSLQLLGVFGGVIGWLFAKPLGNAKNGYQLTGSVFNHTAEVFFPATSDRVTINQEYLGHDVFDQVTLESYVNGTVPVVSGDKLDIAEYEEQYTLIEAGFIRSESTRTLTNKKTGESYELRVSQTFRFNSCRYAPPTEEDIAPVTLRVAKNYIGYEKTKDSIVRYGMSNKISPLGQEDPCVRVRSSCAPHSSCVVQGSTFSCICQKGYTNYYQDNALACIDLDECTGGTHNCDINAECYNEEGSFSCRCKQGFEGDGIRCRAISQCQYKRCDPNAECREIFGEEALCMCKEGFTGNGEQCSPIGAATCNIEDNCSPYATCEYSYSSETYACQCNQGYVGNGYECIESEESTTAANYETAANNEANEADYNATFVLPNCSDEVCICPYGYTSFFDSRNNHLCRDINFEIQTPTEDNNSALTCTTDSDCPPNAACIYSEVSANFECRCNEGYQGDQYECIEIIGVSCSCGSKAHCIDAGAGEHICECDTGYHGDGYICQPNSSCDNDSDCEYHAECRPHPHTRDLVCQCVSGYTKDQNDACIREGNLCNGALCAEHASCLYDEELMLNYCYCDEGYVGIGIESCVLAGKSCDITGDCSADATCTSNPNTYKYECVCNEGYTGDGYSCTLENNCKNRPYLCDVHASCLHNSEGYVCECNAGYFGNGSQCEINPKPPGNFLLASDGVFIYRVPFQNSGRQISTPINSAIDQIAVGINVDCLTGTVYRGDVLSNSIKRVSYDGSNNEIFLNYDIRAPEGIAIDWASRNIFWTDSKKLTIEVANLDSKVRKVLFSEGGITNPRGIAVHSRRGKIFWTDWNRDGPKIEWANMDGTQRGIFLSAPDVALPNSLAIDWANDRLCFADAGLHSIKCVDLETRAQDIIAANCVYPFGLAIYEEKFYWTDWKTLKIEYIDSRTQDRGQIPISSASHRLYGMAVAPEQCEPQANLCQYRNGNCASNELCLPDGNGSRSCL